MTGEHAVLVLTTQCKDEMIGMVRNFDESAQVYQILPCVTEDTGKQLYTLLVVSTMTGVQVGALEGTRQYRDLRTWSGVFTALYGL